MTSDGERWLDRQAGPVVRPYALVKGRTRPPSAAPALIDIVTAATATQAGDGLVGLGPEHRRLLSLCRQPAAVADLASDTDLPLCVVRVMLGDLRERGLILVSRPARQDAEESVLRSVLDGLRAL